MAAAASSLLLDASPSHWLSLSLLPQLRPFTTPSSRAWHSPARSRSLKVSAVQMDTKSDVLESVQEKFNTLVTKTPGLRQKAARKLQELTEDLAKEEEVDEATASLVELDPFEKIKHGFAAFKNEEFLKRPKLFEKLKTGQSPKFMVIACADSRVCPTRVLGFEPGEAFIVRNVANMIPPWNERGFPGTSAALEFAVLYLKVKHVLVIGHSCCGGIKALMSLPDDGKKSSEFIEDWIKIGKPASARVKAIHGSLSFDQQCQHCEKESVNTSLTNLLTFPWLKELVSEGKLTLHGGYYDFVEGSFQMWNLDLKLTKDEVLS